jgi:hypothetical protein
MYSIIKNYNILARIIACGILLPLLHMKPIQPYYVNLIFKWSQQYGVRQVKIPLPVADVSWVWMALQLKYETWHIEL